MKYSEYKKTKEREVTYKFYCWDIDDNEFCTCEGCNAEAPLAVWPHLSNTISLCALCSNSIYEKGEQAQINNAANQVLRLLGYFDDCEIVVKDGE